jgi:N-acetylmuramoyl-L-alanine amidase
MVSSAVASGRLPRRRLARRSRNDRIKRQLVRDLVQENLAQMRGQALRRPRPRRPRLVGTLSLSLVMLALFASSELLPPRSLARHAAAGKTADFAPPIPRRRAAVLSGPPVAAAVFPLAVRKIALDAGHGGDSLGTRTPFGLLEKDITLDIAGRLRQLLEEQNAFQVLMTRQGDHEVSLAERAARANQAGADIFVSIHVNWIGNRGARGVETYYLGPTHDPFLTRLAAAENRDSGYSMADMRPLLERIYAGVRQEKSRKLAEMIQASLFSSLGKVNPKVEDRGVKSAPFIVLLSTQMPAILAEVSCLSNDEEARLLAKPLYRQYIAEALAKGLRAYASLQSVDEKGSDS